MKSALNKYAKTALLMTTYERQFSAIITGFFALLILLQLYHGYIFYKDDQRIATENAEDTVTDYTFDLANYHLFGIYQSPRVDINNLPVTMLPLSLLGLITAAKVGHSQAIIAAANGEQKLYKVGDTLLDNAKIYQIVPQGVILRNNNQLELLAIPKDHV